MKVFVRSATSSSASRWRSTRSVRHSLASSTTLRGRFPLYCSSLASKRANSANASAVDPANPARIFSLYKRRSFRADDFSTSWPRVTCPSPAITTLAFLRTQRMVVDRIRSFIYLFGGGGNSILAHASNRTAAARERNHARDIAPLRSRFGFSAPNYYLSRQNS